MRSSVAAAVVWGILGASCSDVPGLISVNQLPATVDVALGQDLHIASPDLLIRPLEIVEDSRCPVDVQCVDAGTVNMRFSVRQGSAPVSGFFLKLGETNSDYGVLLRVVGVTPDRRTTVPVILAKDYRVRLEISPR